MIGKKAVPPGQQPIITVSSPDNLTTVAQEKQAALQRQLMGGTSYESNNVFKLINR